MHRLVRRHGPWLTAVVGIALVAPAAAVRGPWIETDESAVRLVSRWRVAAASEDAGLGIEFRLSPGWHVYWKNPGDAGYPPAIEVVKGPLDAVELRFPAPRRFELAGGLVAIGYEHEVVYPLSARLTGATESSAAIVLDLDYLVCAEQCIPYRPRLTLALPLAAEPVVDEETAATVDGWRARLPVAARDVPGLVVDASLERATGPELDLELVLVSDELDAPAPDLFFALDPQLVVDRPVHRFDARGHRFSVHLRPIDETRPLPERLVLEWTATGFALDGRALALVGDLELARPLPAATLGAPLRWLVAFGLVALLAGFIHRRNRGRRPHAEPPN